MSHLDDVRAWHRAIGHTIANRPGLPAIEWGDEAQMMRLTVRALLLLERAMQDAPAHPRRLRACLLSEEMREYLEAELQGDLVAIADALGDISVITDGTALTYGIPLDQIRAEIHASNMSKLDDYDQPIYRADGKIEKGPRYCPPDILRVLNDAQREADT